MAEQSPFENVGFPTGFQPPCPCVLLLDVSASMNTIVASSDSAAMTRIDHVNEGVKTYHADLMSDGIAAQRVDVSVMTFGETVETVTPFTQAAQFTPPTLTANGNTPMGEAILRAIDAVEERKKFHRQRGLAPYRPWIFLITDGEPTDEWSVAADAVRDGEAQKKFAFFAVGVPGANFDILKRISAARLPLELKGNNFKSMFLWLSSSQRRISTSQPGLEDQVALESPRGWANL
jgi:uncharacterized protein YegL